MTKKVYQNKEGRKTRSKPRKQFYQKFSFWLFTILLVLIAIFSVNVFTDKKDMEHKQTVSKDTENNTENNNETNENINEAKKEQVYTYEDFQGTYALFDGDPYESGASVRYKLEDNQYQVHDFWEYGLEVDILSKNIEGNVLTIEYHVEDYEYYGFDEEHITEEFELRRDGNSKTLHSLTNGKTLHSISEDDLQKHYDQLEIDYARIVMTVIGGEIPLDAWAVSSPVTMHISHSSANEPLGGWGDAPSYPNNVTHLTSNLINDLTHLSDAIYNSTITYYAHGDGNITLYYLNKEGAERVGQERIEDLGTIYVDPSEPYFIADFIGRVKFIYE